MIPTRLKALRKDKKLTQKQLADRTGVAISAISSYESGNRLPTYDTMVKFARIFHVSTDYLLGMEEVKRLDLTGLDEDSIELVTRIADKLRN